MRSIQNYLQQAKHSSKSVLYVVAFLPCFILPFSPLLSYFSAMFMLLLFTRFNDYIILYILGFNIAVSGSLIWASRVYFDSDADDFLRYFDTYKEIFSGHYGAFFSYGGGFEIGFPSFYLLLNTIFGRLYPSEILFFTILVPSLLMVVWVIKYGIFSLNVSHRALCLFFVFLFFNFYAPSEWSRQSFACVFILFAFSQQKYHWKFFFLLIACLFHLTSLPIFFILEFLKHRPKLTLSLVVLGSLSFVFSFEFILMAYKIGIIPHIGILEKLNFYSIYQERGIFMNLNLSFMFVLFCMGLLFSVRIWNDEMKKYWVYFYIVFLWCYIVFLPFSYASNRLTLIFNSFLLGYMFFVCIRNFSILAYGVGFLLLLGKFAYWIFDPASKLWFSYPYYGNFLYYFSF
ncbi:EpsG family protein [Helicobacter cappadocius]|uniref:EpsG family protein n=1 Tax=Helicobacter cappadocius TaxID=3063998 RepID=A0AA90PT56_9HELI|nr:MULTISPECIES: EpsG family protein [unclassified Helicobacter]MDO7253002.1 EpsG family protein [Helicobacter sp. faydin-H75]MDP2539009.1 EpsG family protein [Helicobacter sp. faydin-H76]